MLHRHYAEPLGTVTAPWWLRHAKLLKAIQILIPLGTVTAPWWLRLHRMQEVTASEAYRFISGLVPTA